MNDKRSINQTLCDAHVHIYADFNLSKFLNSAWNNFNSWAALLGAESSFTSVLMLSEAKNNHFFSELTNAAKTGQSPACQWQFQRTAEDESILALGPDDSHIYILSGRQIVTAENLEVLALATTAERSDGAPIAEVIDWVNDVNGLPILPWGFGKWWGKRGKIMSRLIETSTREHFFIGDNGGRPWFLSTPYHFTVAERQDRLILPGSDPLPFRSESWRPGSVGFSFSEAIDPSTPAESLRRYLRDPDTDIKTNMHRERLLPFMRNQVAMQLRKRIP